MVKIEEKNLFIKPIWSNKVNTSSSLKKIFVKGDFFKTLNNLIQLYKKKQSLSEKKFILTLVDYLFQVDKCRFLHEYDPNENPYVIYLYNLILYVPPQHILNKFR